jgi:phosphoribosylformylglycinamidine synthase subunit PurQ / glutaminase
MPHPERASEASLGATDGLRLFQGLLDKIAAYA